MLIKTGILLVILLYIPSQAFAYLDPGAGSMLLQIILGGIAGLMVFGRMFWKKLKRGLFSKTKKPIGPQS